MSDLRVTIEQLTIHPHPNADRLELAQVGLYRAVVGKGEFESGDYALYIPEQAVLPDELIEELGLTGKLAGKDKNRVKAVRLRGEVSQGIVCRPKAIAPNFWVTPTWRDTHEDDNFAGSLGILKWVPDIPAHMNGEITPEPDLVRWIDIENLQRYPTIFEPGESVVATEKIHGTACLVTYLADEDRLIVSSKGHGAKNLGLVESDTNLYWRAAKASDLHQLLGNICVAFQARKVAVFGEVFGAGVQDLHYGHNVAQNRIGYRAFDVKISYPDHNQWVDASMFHLFCASWHLIPVPLVYDGPFDLAKLTEAASGDTKVGGGNIREGVVIRPAFEEYSDVLGGRKIAKLVSPAYLLRKGDTTEYE